MGMADKRSISAHDKQLKVRDMNAWTARARVGCLIPINLNIFGHRSAIAICKVKPGMIALRGWWLWLYLSNKVLQSGVKYTLGTFWDTGRDATCAGRRENYVALQAPDVTRLCLPVCNVWYNITSPSALYVSVTVQTHVSVQCLLWFCFLSLQAATDSFHPGECYK